MRFELTFFFRSSTALNALPYLQINAFGASANSTRNNVKSRNGDIRTLYGSFKTFSVGFSF
uniref:hypothetical protein n=1 Tax=uncultured Dysgonomonas sp. TaxID=206096 RepID=UPI0026068C14|nr:hypothetical protein [uncultured Dysgonomonas sp.]